MTTRINILSPTPLEKVRRAELEALTGCPIHHVIEGSCQEPGCQNAALQLEKEFVLSKEDCLRLKEIVLEGGTRLAEQVTPPAPRDNLPLQREVPPSYPRDAAPIFQTKPRLRCVL